MVWLTEISVPELFSHKRYSLGEVIIDPTCPINIFGSDKAIIAIHLPGIIFWNDFEENQLSLIRTKDDVPYQHIIRF